jgi:hypothetical protein
MFISLLKDLFARSLDEGVEARGECGHAVAEIVEGDADGGEGCCCHCG